MATWTFSSAGAERPGLVAWLACQIARLAEARERRRLARATMNELERLSDRDLADIGIMRCDIPDVAREAAGGAATAR
jgi:uncharacterized protein YjiS (DUF1127 family)